MKGLEQQMIIEVLAIISKRMIKNFEMWKKQSQKN